MRLRLGFARIVLVVVPVAVAPARAQTRDTTSRDTVVLAPIEVITSIVRFAGPRIGSGIPARITTFTGRDIDAWEPRTLADALGSRAGVSIYDDLGSPYKLNLSTRGFNVGPVVGLPPGVSVFLDGVRQNEADAAQVNFDLLPLEHVKRIELLSGAGSLLGPNSLGGAVNLITRRGEGPREAELELSGGSFDTYSAEGSVAGVSREWDYYVAGGYERAGGWRRATLGRNYNAFANVGRLGPTRGVRFQAFSSTSYAETAGSLPESVFDTAPRTNFTAGDFEDLDLLQLAVTGYAPTGPGRGALTLYVRRHDAERFNVNQAPDPNVHGTSRNRTLGGNLDWEWQGAVDGREVSLRAGLDGARNSVNIRLIEEDPADPTNDSLTTDVDSPSWDLAAYATTDIRLGRVTLSAGVRHDYIRVPFEDNLDPTADTSSTFRRWSPRGGVSVALGPAASVYASAGQSFRAPAVLELACADETAACPLPFALGDDPPLDPVVGTTYEMGARWAVGRILLDGALYRTDVRDDISFISSDSAVYAGYFANIGATRREGVELSAQTQWTAGHSVYANYAYTRASFRTAADIFSLRSDSAYVTSPYFGDNAVESGDRLPLVPEHQVRVGVAMALGRGLDAGIDARYTGRQWLRGDEANETRPLEAYVTANLRVAWESRGGTWSIAGIVTNVFDSQRAVFGTFNENRQTGELERFLTPLQARSFKLIVRRGFRS
jgi:outer membrane receptor protein involved in Fe transport